MAALEQQNGTAALALRFTILTAARTGEVLGARWSEIDLQAAVWTIPASRMKAGIEHRVPLSSAALVVLGKVAKLRQTETDSPVFPGGKGASGLASTALSDVLRRMRRSDLTAHGCRSTFRGWAAETTSYQREVLEAALAHTIGDKTEAAYRRGDLFEKRRRLMNDWAAFCGRTEPAATARVVRIGSAA
jgi:integrase